MTNKLHSLFFFNGHRVRNTNRRSSIKNADVLSMKMVQDVNSSPSVEDISGRDDVPNCFDSVEQHTKELNEKNYEEKDNENKVDWVKRHVGSIWYDRGSIEWHC